MTTTKSMGMTKLESNECWALLRTCEVGRLAVTIGEHPDIFPVNFVVDHGTVVFRTAEGTKLAASVLSRAVAFEVDGYDAASGEAWSVVVKGAAHEVERMHDLFEIADLSLFPWHAGPKHRYVRIVAVDVTGRRFHVVDPTTADRVGTGARRAASE
jgi:nitroimidazol reductase NimA-like FMN-containing flavoprotein (pyridoxamine 5'-phosphate oxidase superfamily)